MNDKTKVTAEAEKGKPRQTVKERQAAVKSGKFKNTALSRADRQAALRKAAANK